MIVTAVFRYCHSENRKRNKTKQSKRKAFRFMGTGLRAPGAQGRMPGAERGPRRAVPGSRPGSSSASPVRGRGVGGG